MLSIELEIILNEAFQSAREARHEFMTVEHLLLAVLDAPVVRKAAQACGADVDRLQRELTEFVDETTPRLEEDHDREVQPTLGFQRVLQQAVLHLQSSGGKEVTTVDVLVAVFSEKNSHAVSLLSKQDVARRDVVNYVDHGISRGRSEIEAEDAVFGDQTLRPTHELRTCLRAAFRDADEQLHKCCTVEHLLSTISGGADAQEALRHCGVDAERLLGDLKDFLHYATPRRAHSEGRVQSWTGVLRLAIDRATSNARSRGGGEITCDDVLVAVFSEKYSPAAYLLSRQKISPLEVADRLRSGQGHSPSPVQLEDNPPETFNDSDGAASDLEAHVRKDSEAALAARYEFLTVEHLLKTILDDPYVCEALRACNGDVERLHQELSEFVDRTTPRLKDSDDRAPQPTLGYQRVLTRATFYAQTTDSRRAVATDVLVAIFSEKHSHAAYLLSMHDIARAEVLEHVRGP